MPGKPVPEMPLMVQIEPSGKCNLRCPMCMGILRPVPGSGMMDFCAYVRLVEQLPGLQELHLQGLGEPMLHPDFFRMVEIAARQGISVSTNSNLSLMDKARAERCVASSLDCLHISVDAANPAVYAGMRPGGTLERVQRGVEMLAQARARQGSGRPKLRIVAVLMRQNLEELPGLVRLAAKWPVEGLFVQHLCHSFGEPDLPSHYLPMRSFYRTQALTEEDPKRLQLSFAVGRRAACRHRVELRLPSLEPRTFAGEGSPACDWPWRGMYISYDGQAMPCCMVGTPDRASMGDVFEQGVEAIWHGAAYQEFRARLSSDDPPAVCRYCSVYSHTF